MPKHVYFIAYELMGGNGNTEVYLDAPITMIEDIEEIQHLLQESYPDGGQVVVTNFILLRKEEDYAH